MFYPWIGKDFKKSGNYLEGLRLLILGESHYCRGHPEKKGMTDPEFTRETVTDLAFRSYYPFFAGLTCVISNTLEYPDDKQVEKLWHSVAFYNYVPVFVADGAGIAPNNKMFAMGVEPFSWVLNIFKPEKVVVCGHNLWTHVLKGFPDADPTNHDYCLLESVPAIRIMHPSAGEFKTEVERPRVQRFIQQ